MALREERIMCVLYLPSSAPIINETANTIKAFLSRNLDQLKQELVKKI